MTLSSTLVKGVLLKAFSKKLSKKYLFEHFSQMGGIGTKIAQIMSSGDSEGSERSEGSGGKEVFPQGVDGQVFKDILNIKLPFISLNVKDFSCIGYPASLGQVHRVKLNDGRDLAIKFFYPGMKQQLLGELDEVFEKFPKFAPKKILPVVKDYKKYFSENLLKECDYVNEARNQEYCFKAWSKNEDIIVPKVYVDECVEDVLVQDFVEGRKFCGGGRELGYDEGVLLLEVLLFQFFSTMCMHGDLHLGNIRLSEGQGQGQGQGRTRKIIFYDYGSIIYVEKKAVEAIYNVFCGDSGYRGREFFLDMGFNQEILGIEDRLDELLKILLRPFLVSDFSFAQWNLKREISELLGEEKWIFRRSGPAWFMHFMRSVQGVSGILKMGGMRYPVREILEGVIKKYGLFGMNNNNNQDFQDTIKGSNVDPTKLCVLVKKLGKMHVSLTMPARSVENLRDLIPPDSLEELEKKGVDVEGIAKDAVEDFRAKTLFQQRFGEKEYLVWLE